MWIDSILNYFASGLNSQNLLVSIIFIIVYAIAVLIMMSVFAYIFGWVERKMIAKVQRRHGPNRVGKWGIFQNLADLVKLLAKEKMVPKNADAFLMNIAPILLVSIVTFIILLIPFSSYLQASDIGLGLLLIFVLLGFTPILLFIAGYASGGKFAEIGAQRSVLMLISYEIPMIIVVATIGIISGSYNLISIINMQKNIFYAFLMPIGLFVFFVVMLAELERPPFDLREADSELIAGWLTDISAPYYAVALMLDYTRMFMGSLLIAILFFGGWSGPILPGIVWLIIKAFIISIFIIIIRVSAVRMRIDKILKVGWMYLLPLSIVNLLLTIVLIIK
ncbi:MAG: complex I subunit 1/NuoH family protein [Candidatus Micrarchaeia archaeon]